MNKIIEINQDQYAEWDSFVHDHKFGWLYHLSSWKKLLEHSFPHIKGNIYCLIDSGTDRIIAGMPIYTIKSHFIGNRLSSIPFSSFSDPLVDNEKQFKQLLIPIMQQFKQSKSEYLEIKSLHSSQFINIENAVCDNQITFHDIPLTDPPEILKKSFHRTCVRQRITRAQKSNLSLAEVHDSNGLKSFYNLYMKTRKRLGKPVRPFRFFLAMFNTYEKDNKISLMLARLDNKDVAGLLLFKYKDRVSAEYAASDSSYKRFSPNHFLFWEAIKKSYSEGYKFFDFGETPSDNQNLSKFKGYWGTEVKQFSNFTYPATAATNRGNKFSYKIISTLCRNSPSIFQQLIGNFLYNHLG